jgi:hypothetical protein
MTAVEQLSRTILLCRDYVEDRLSNEEICGCLQSVRVLCVSDIRNLSSHGGQTALVTLVSLLNRMGMQVALALPEVAMLSAQPPLSGFSLREALIASNETLVAGATVRGDCNVKPDVTFVLGDTRIDMAPEFSWRLTGGDWFGGLVMEGGGRSATWTSALPLGSMASAAMAANEAFKFAMRRLCLRDKAHRVYFEPSRFCMWDFGATEWPEEGVDLSQVDFVSGGAICQAALYVFMRLPKVRMRGRVIDDDLTDESNLNRNMLTVGTDVGSSKVHVIAQRCRTKLQIEPVLGRFGEGGPAGRLAPRVLVGVDHIPSRWVVQRHASGWVAVSGTSHFNISSSSHGPGEPCSGCLHPIDDDGVGPIPTISYISFWAGLGMAVRLVREALASPYPPNKQHLWLTPFRMDQPHAAMWSPVAPRRDCPVNCQAAQALRAAATAGRS